MPSRAKERPAQPAVKQEKPATKPAKPAAKPAAEKPAVKEGLGLRDLANALKRDPKSVRASIRRLKGGAQVGQGGRYHWASEKDPEYQELLKALTAKPKETQEVKAS